MSAEPLHPELRVERNAATHVATVEILRPPHNYFDLELMEALGDFWEQLDADPGCRAIVLCSAGTHFSAGRDFGTTRREDDTPANLYQQGLRLLSGGTPWVAAVQGGAIGGGMGLAAAADFRVVGESSYFRANFTRLAYHPGFGLTATLPRILGAQRASDLLLTGRRIGADEAMRWGLADRLVADSDIRGEAESLAAELAAAGPLAVRATRATLRGDWIERVRAAVEVEAREQDRLRATRDFAEGVVAARERRIPEFHGE